jgi:hypothetical protein
MAALSYWEKSRIHQFLQAIGSYVKSVSAGTGASVDNTDPQNPVVLAKISTDLSNAITLGTDDGLYAVAGGGVTYTDTGITIVGGGLLGAVVDPSLISAQIRGMCTGTYDYSTVDSWQLWVSPTPASGTFTLDVWKRSFGNTLPSAADSICAGAYPTLTGNGTDFTASGATSTWTGSLVRGDMMTVVPTVNTAGVKWWALYIPARRTF